MGKKYVNNRNANYDIFSEGEGCGYLGRNEGNQGSLRYQGRGQVTVAREERRKN
jgi:hypothetical protein